MQQKRARGCRREEFMSPTQQRLVLALDKLSRSLEFEQHQCIVLLAAPKLRVATSARKPGIRRERPGPRQVWYAHNASVSARCERIGYKRIGLRHHAAEPLAMKFDKRGALRKRHLDPRWHNGERPPQAQSKDGNEQCNPEHRVASASSPARPVFGRTHGLGQVSQQGSQQGSDFRVRRFRRGPARHAIA